MDRSIRRLRLSAFTTVITMPEKTPRSKVAVLKLSCMGKPAQGWCPNPDNSWGTCTEDQLALMEQLLRYFHATCFLPPEPAAQSGPDYRPGEERCDCCHHFPHSDGGLPEEADISRCYDWVCPETVAQGDGGDDHCPKDVCDRPPPPMSGWNSRGHRDRSNPQSRRMPI